MESKINKQYVLERLDGYFDLEEAVQELLNTQQPIHSGNDDTVLEVVVDSAELEEVERCLKRLQTTGGQQQ